MLLGSLSVALAEASVDAQIEAIKNTTSQQERVRLTNEFKTTLSTLSQEEREAAIEKLRSGMDGDGVKVRERVRERVRLNQMDETRERQENQRMNQNQVGSQFMQQNPSITPDPSGTPNRFMNNR
ncbi:MAG: hypothetical protein QG559_422 [Campylobacterota bacterium]|nr:hypothetical protein [Campylobacterota bacterium]